jgi:hypothetical protein
MYRVKCFVGGARKRTVITDNFLFNTV